jgi:tRNA A-37 threonylcarbamoyl transferase component Bud32
MKLIFTSGVLADNRYDVERDVTIGRDISNDIILSDTSVSLVHAQISCNNHRYFIKDLGSTNGIKLNGEKVISAELNDGDGVAIGKNSMRIEATNTDALTTVAGMPDEPQSATIMDSAAALEQETLIDESDLSGNIAGAVSYFLKRKIAKGGMGAIYEAEQIGAEGFLKKVAIKSILPSFAEKESFVSSFVGEAKLVANLVHQNIVQIHHLGRHNNGYFIAMEYIDGINLTDFMIMHRRLNLRVPAEIATFIMSRVSRGLEYAHAKTHEDGESLGLVHRDVSPNNIMINREGEVKLTDFGVAKAAQFMVDDDDYLVGSVEYMSPEQAACLDVDLRSDIFSVGVVFFELLTGLRIFRCKDNDIDDTLERVIEAEIPDPTRLRSDLPDDVIEPLMKCLEKDRDRRYQDSSVLVYDLEHAIYSRGYGPTTSKMASYLKTVEGKAREASAH